MSHPLRTRASARTSALLRAHADVAARGPLALLLAFACIISVAVVTTAASAASAATAERSSAISTVSSPPDVHDAGFELPAALADVAADAARTMTNAQQVVADAEALNAEVKKSKLTIKGVDPVVDAGALRDDIAALAAAGRTAPLTVVQDTARTAQDIGATVAATTDLRTAFNTAEKKKAAAEKAAAELAAANTPSGAKHTAKRIAADKYGWGSGQFSCLVSLWNKESGWNYRAYNPSGATGIPQALPGGKMASAGADWRTNAATQVKWGLAYIDRAYGSPCAAWGHSQATNWY